MMLWLQLDSILNGLSPQIPTKHPKQLRHTKIPPRYNNTLPLSQKLQETSQDSSRHHYKTPPDIFKHSKGLSGAVVFVKWNQGGAIMPFWHNPEIQDFFRLILFKHQNSNQKKNTPYKLFNNYWVMPFLVFLTKNLRFDRDKLFVTVAFDHPVFQVL